MNVSDCEGFDGNPAEDGFTPYTPKKRIEIFAPDELVKIIFDTLIQAANTHHSDAGKVYLIEVSKNGRINDGASGNSS
jgi:nitrogen regulatory protein P-II 1